jgi:UDPglucose 6-dehydrogenase
VKKVDLCVVGLGPVGLVHAACMAEIGHQVICIDKDEEKVANLSNGKIPFIEKGLQELLAKNIRSGKVVYSSDIRRGVREAKIVFICVGTPMDADGGADMRQVMDVALQIAKSINEYKVIVVKSTVPVGTTQLVTSLIADNMVNKVDFDVVSNPEFLREGSGIGDTFNGDRIVIGSKSLVAIDILTELYRSLAVPLLITLPESSEMIKYASNTFLATKISFINEIANICEKVGADVKEVAKGMGMDQRIGSRFLEAGIGFGGSCFPKDVNAVIKLAEEKEYDFSIARQVLAVNQRQVIKPVKILENYYGRGKLTTKKIALLGLAFKPGTDDLREAPAVKIARELIARGCQVKAYDPVIRERQESIPAIVKICQDPYSAVKGCHGIILATQWAEFSKLDLPRVRYLVNTPLFIDGRNYLDGDKLRDLGFTYYGIGVLPGDHSGRSVRSAVYYYH